MGKPISHSRVPSGSPIVPASTTLRTNPHRMSQRDMLPLQTSFSEAAITRRPRFSMALPALTPSNSFDGPSPPSFTPSQKRAKVLWDWKAASATEVSCSAGEVVTLLDDASSSEWRFVRTSSGQEGYIGNNYLQLIEASGVNISAASLLGSRRP